VKFSSYWQDDVLSFSGTTGAPSGHYDVVVIGAGFTGLGAARKLAKEGAKVAVFEAETVGFGASGRNGGHVNNGIAHSFTAACAQFGEDTAIAMYRSYDDGVDTIERIIREEGIACNFKRTGKLKLASKPQHMAGIESNFEAIHRLVDSETALLNREELGSEIGSDVFHGAMLQRKSASMHMGHFVAGLANAADRHGAEIYENTPVLSVEKDLRGHQVITPNGKVTADNVLLATGAYTTKAFGWFSRRIIPVGSFLIATRPLTRDEIEATLPGDRTCVTSMNVGNYFRLSPDNRLLFGGRARFSANSNQSSDAKGGAILRAAMTEMFPHLADVEVDYCWGGMIDMTKDRYPRTGQAGGLHYAMGYSGSGAQIAAHLGEIMADQMSGIARENPWADLPWPQVPGHFGKPWFLPFVGAYYKFKDKIS